MDYVDECRISVWIPFVSYSTSALSNNDEVRIVIHNSESYTLPCNSCIYIEALISKPEEVSGDIVFVNNGLVFFFSEIRYEMNGVQIQKLVNPGITTT